MIWEEDIGKRIAQLRIKKGVSAREMSLSIGQSASYIINVESGHNLPSFSAFLYICEYLGITPCEFFQTDVEDPAAVSEIMQKIKKLKPDQLSALSAMIDHIK